MEHVLKEVGHELKEVQDEQLAYAIKDTKERIHYILNLLDNPPKYVRESAPREFVDWHVYRYEQLADLFATLVGLIKVWSDDVIGEE